MLRKIYGLRDDTIQFFGIKPNFSEQAWSYPVTDGIRFKKYDRQGPRKYWHTPGTPNQLYGYDDLKSGTEEIWLVNGEPVRWVMWQAGIPALCGLYGEGQLPENTCRLLSEKGVQLVHYVPDMDQTGRRASLKIYGQLTRELQVRIRQLPAELGGSGDICDLYNWHDADDAGFRKALNALPDNDPASLNTDLPGQKKPEEVTLVCLSEVQVEPVYWLWYPYIALAKLTSVEGDPGVGKSTVCLAIGTAVSLGKGLPGVLHTEPRRVLLASAEDGLGDTVRPRLDAMGADVGNIHAVKGALDFKNDGLNILANFIEVVQPALIIIDPLVAYIGARVDIYRANETRTIMAQLAELAEKSKAAILVVRHLTKGTANKPIYRAQGNIDITAACRSALLAGCDPDDAQKRALAHIKSNLAPAGPSIGYQIRDGKFHWTGESDLTAARILAGQSEERTSALAEAMDFLKEELACGPVEASQGWKDAQAVGIAEKTLKRAKRQLHVITRRQGKSGKRGVGNFIWMLPDESAMPAKDLGGQEGHTHKFDPLNSSSLEKGSDLSEVGPLNPGPKWCKEL